MHELELLFPSEVECDDVTAVVGAVAVLGTGGITQETANIITAEKTKRRALKRRGSAKVDDEFPDVSLSIASVGPVVPDSSDGPIAPSSSDAAERVANNPKISRSSSALDSVPSVLKVLSPVVDESDVARCFRVACSC